MALPCTKQLGKNTVGPVVSEYIRPAFYDGENYNRKNYVVANNRRVQGETIKQSNNHKNIRVRLDNRNSCNTVNEQVFLSKGNSANPASIKFTNNYQTPHYCQSYVNRYNKSNRWIRRPKIMHPKDTEACSKPYYVLSDSSFSFPRFISPYVYDSDYSDTITTYYERKRRKKKKKKKNHAVQVILNTNVCNDTKLLDPTKKNNKKKKNKNSQNLCKEPKVLTFTT